MEIKKVDILIVGSGGAGMRAAIEAAQNNQKVMVSSKGRIGRSGATVMAAADMSVDSRSAKKILGLDGDNQDNRNLFYDDIVNAGKYINNQSLVETLVDEAPNTINELMGWGLPVLGLIQAPGHRYPRGVWTSGKAIMRTLGKQTRKYANIVTLEDTVILDLLTDGNRVCGATGINLRTGKAEIIAANAIVIASGGAQMIYPVQTAAYELTGDGQAMAWRSGADLIDMEMVQFLPFVVMAPPAWRGMGFPLLSMREGGLEGWLLNKNGYRFMRDWDVDRMEYSTRDRLALAIMNEVLAGRGSPAGGVFLSFSHLPKNIIEYFRVWAAQTYYKNEWVWLKKLIDEIQLNNAIEIGVGCHFFMGGIRVDKDGATNVKGLYAAGEASGGLHGANRLSGNACSQFMVQGKCAGAAAATYASGIENTEIKMDQVDALLQEYFLLLDGTKGISPYKIKNKTQEIAGENVGVIRHGEGLRKTLAAIKTIIENDLPKMRCRNTDRLYNREWLEALQVKNMLTVLKAITLSAEHRTESRGSHYRLDCTQEDNSAWLKNIVIKNKDNQMQVSSYPLVRTRGTAIERI